MLNDPFVLCPNEVQAVPLYSFMFPNRVSYPKTTQICVIMKPDVCALRHLCGMGKGKFIDMSGNTQLMGLPLI